MMRKPYHFAVPHTKTHSNEPYVFVAAAMSELCVVSVLCSCFSNACRAALCWAVAGAVYGYSSEVYMNGSTRFDQNTADEFGGK